MPTGICGKNLTYRIDGGTLTISGAGDMIDCKLKPRAADWYRHGLPIKSVDINAGVASVGHYAFMRDTNLTRVSIPSDTDFIGHLSFYGCTNLTSVTLKNFSRRNSLTRNYIDGSAFAFCIRLSAIEIPPNIEFIGDNAFHGCKSLTSVTLPAALNQIGNNVFSGCTRLKKIYYAAGFNFANKLIEGNSATLIPYQTNQPTWKWKLIGSQLTVYGAGPMRDYFLPNKPPPWYGKRASIKSVFVKRDITYLGDFAFADCVNLTRAVIASSVTSINQKAFAGCTSLGKGIYHPSKFNLPPNQTHVPKTDYVLIIDGNFYQPSHRRKPSAIQKIYFVLTDKPVDFKKFFSRFPRPPEMEIVTNHKEIRDGAFEGCTSFEKIKIPEGVERIGKRAFADCTSLEVVILPASLKEIAAEAFMDCTSLEKVTFPKNFSVTIGKDAFKNSPYGARRQSEFLADKIARERKSLGEKFSAHVLPNELPAVEDELVDPPDPRLLSIIFFADKIARERKSLGEKFSAHVLPNELPAVEDELVDPPDPRLLSIIFFADKIARERKSLGEKFSAHVLPNELPAVEDELVDPPDPRLLSIIFFADKIARERKSLGEKFSAHVLPNELPAVEDELVDPPVIKKNFCGKNLTWTLDDNSTLTISGTGEMYDYGYGGNPWFAQKNLIQRVVVNVGVKKIGQRAFQFCGKLSEIILPDGVEEIGKEALWYCKKLKSITFPPSVVSIGQLAFYKCASLTSVTIPPSVRRIGYDIFFDCKNLARICYRKIYRNRMEVLKRKLSAGNNAKLILLP